LSTSDDNNSNGNGNGNNAKKRIDWDKKYLPTVIEQLADFERQGIKPTFRGMYYTLVDLGILPKTEANYSALNKASVRWREHHLIDFDSFADHTRSIVKNFDDEYESHEDYVNWGINYLKYAKLNYKIPLWYKQLHYVEIWLEKDAAVGTFESIVEGLEVVVVPNRGHSSIAFIHQNIKRLKEKQAEGKKIHILYFGDEDPSGEIMDKVYKEKFAEYGIFDVDFKRFAVTWEQTKRFGLQTNPDREAWEKMMKDPNKFSFMERHDMFKFSDDPHDESIIIGKRSWVVSRTVEVVWDEASGINKYKKHDPKQMFAVQLEAMQTPKVRAYLRALVRYNIDKWYDNDIHKQVLKDHPESELERLVLLETEKFLVDDRLTKKFNSMNPKPEIRDIEGVNAAILERFEQTVFFNSVLDIALADKFTLGSTAGINCTEELASYLINAARRLIDES
jgi:hypothetical protein